MDNFIIKVLKRMVCGKRMQRRRKWSMARAQFCTGSDVVKVADKGCRGNIFIGVDEESQGLF